MSATSSEVGVQVRVIRILLVTRNLPPLRGGMERLNRHLAIELAREFRVDAVGPYGAGEFLPPQIHVDEVAAAPLWKFFGTALWCSLRAAWRGRPDIVLGGSGLVAPFIWFAGRIVGARVALYVHGLDLIAEHSIFRWFWRPFIRRADLCVANSANTASLARSIGVAAERLTVVHPGVDSPPPEIDPKDFRVRFGVGSRPLLLSVGRLIARKGLLEFVEKALPLIVATMPDVCVVVLGDETPDLLQGSSVGLGERIRQRASELGVAANLLFVGPQDDATLGMAYRAADAHIFPVRNLPGDVEGFGMVAVEAAAHGLPTVAFAVGGVPDAVHDGVSGYLVPPDDFELFAAKTTELLNVRASKPLGMSALQFAQSFVWENFGVLLRERMRALVPVIAFDKRKT